jgi:membrane-associated protein
LPRIGSARSTSTASSKRAVGYPRRRFVWLAAIGSVTWAAYSSVIGIGAGAWFRGHPVGAVVVAVVSGLLIGVVLDWALSRLQTRRGRGAAPVGHRHDDVAGQDPPLMADSTMSD